MVEVLSDEAPVGGVAGAVGDGPAADVVARITAAAALGAVKLLRGTRNRAGMRERGEFYRLSSRKEDHHRKESRCLDGLWLLFPPTGGKREGLLCVGLEQERQQVAHTRGGRGG